MLSSGLRAPQKQCCGACGEGEGDVAAGQYCPSEKAILLPRATWKIYHQDVIQEPFPRADTYADINENVDSVRVLHRTIYML